MECFSFLSPQIVAGYIDCWRPDHIYFSLVSFDLFIAEDEFEGSFFPQGFISLVM